MRVRYIAKMVSISTRGVCRVEKNFSDDVVCAESFQCLTVEFSNGFDGDLRWKQGILEISPHKEVLSMPLNVDEAGELLRLMTKMSRKQMRDMCEQLKVKLGR